jgi:hypothetical protein
LEVLAGAAAGMAQTVITNPMELLKIRMQLFYEYQVYCLILLNDINKN